MTRSQVAPDTGLTAVINGEQHVLKGNAMRLVAVVAKLADMINDLPATSTLSVQFDGEHGFVIRLRNVGANPTEGAEQQDVQKGTMTLSASVARTPSTEAAIDRLAFAAEKRRRSFRR